jgi:hypothetical protein
MAVESTNNLGNPGPGYAWRLAGGKVQWEAQRVERAAAARPDLAPGRRLAAAFMADFLKDGPRMWSAIEFNAKLAGYKPAALERARGTVAEPFKRTEADGRWLWRLIGDERTSSPGDVADFFGGDELGLAGPSGKGAKAPRRSPTMDEIEADEEDEEDEERR